MKKFEDTAANIVIIWADEVAFSDDLARTFFTANIAAMLYSAFAMGRKVEARKRKASISARHVKRLTQRAPDLAKATPKCECNGEYYHADCKLVFRNPPSG